MPSHGPYGSLALLVAQHLVTAIAAGFTDSHSVLRIGLLLPQMVLAGLMPIMYRDSPIQHPLFVVIPPTGAIVNLLQYIKIVLIRRWTFERERTLLYSRRTFQRPAWLERLQFGFFASSSYRYCGTKLESVNVPQFSQFRSDTCPTKKQFLIHNLGTLALCVLLLDASAALNDPEQEMTPTAASREPLLSRMGHVTAGEVIERAIIVTLTYVSAISFINILFTILPLVLVAAGLSEPIWWKPHFNLACGFPYSVRRFWSHFWHLTLRDCLYTPSKFVTDDIIGLPSGSLLRRYALIFLSFGLSGFLHKVGEVAGGVPYAEDAALFYFFSQAAAIMFEDAVAHVWHSFFPRRDKSVSTPPRWHTFVGKIWVALFMIWVTPFWVYPITRLTSQLPMLPYGPVRTLVSFLGYSTS